jgi:hypothetical protein
MKFELSHSSLKTLQDHELLSRAHALAQDERRAGIALLHHLREIERRRLYARSHGSLHEYVVRELGYSDGAAHRRISAMRLLQVVPELEAKLQSGAVSLSTASQVQNFVRAEKRMTGSEASAQDLRSLVAAIEGKSSRQTEAMLAARSPQVAMAIRERPRSIDGSNLQVTVVLSAELQEKLQKLRDRFSHQNSNSSLAEQLEMLADFALRKMEPSKEANREAVVKDVRCARTHLLQLDHRFPRAWGGGNELTNLQLLCAVHNQVKCDRLPHETLGAILGE